MPTVTVLPAIHTSAETAYLVADYPYGFRLRCQIRHWIEYKPGKGFRHVSQTSNPKAAGLVWNKPKAGTYARFGGALYLDEAGHLHFAGLSEYSDGKEATAYRDTFGAGVPVPSVMNAWVAAKVAYDAARQPGDRLDVGTAEAATAYLAELAKR